MTLDQLKLLSSYNTWMNQRLYAVCAELTDEQRKQDRGAFFKSIHGTLNHLLLGDKVWLGRFKGRPFAVTSLDQELYADFEALWTARQTTDQEICDWVAGLEHSQLAAPLRYSGVARAGTRSYPLWLVVTHLFNHQTHHRGQITTLLSQYGKDVGVTDLIGMPELQLRFQSQN